jgi:hypothetical protein
MYKLILATLLLGLGLSVQAADTKRPDFSKLCQGKVLNSKVNTQFDGRRIEGTCQLGFKPKQANALERGAMREPAVQNACMGKAKGAAVNVKVGAKSIAGQCDVVFKSAARR